MKRNIRFLVLSLLSAWSLSSCATSYQSFGLTGGYKQIQESEDTWRIRVDGNSYTSQERIAEFTSRRCAEIALENGKRYYQVVSQSVNTLEGIVAGTGTPYGKATIKLLDTPMEGEGGKDALKVIKETESSAKGNLSAKAAKAMKAFESEMETSMSKQ